MHYRVKMTSDMGHLDIHPDSRKGLPEKVSRSIYDCAKVFVERDLVNMDGIYIATYRLKEGVRNPCSFKCGDDTVVVDFSEI